MVTATDSGGLSGSGQMVVKVIEVVAPPPKDVVEQDLVQEDVVQEVVSDGVVSDSVVDGEEPCPLTEFTYTGSSTVSKVQLAGSFNGWGNPFWEMSDADGDKTWVYSADLEPGTYQYKFVVDGVWLADPENPDKVDDTYGAWNSVITVGACP